MTPKNIEMGRAGRARRTMPRMRLVIQRPYIGGRETSKLMDRTSTVMTLYKDIPLIRILSHTSYHTHSND